MKPLRTIVVDDEAPARRKLVRMLALAAGVEVAGEAAEAAAALAAIQAQRPDLAFVDVQMPGASGLELAAAAAQLPAPPQIVFVTAHDAFALRAFELHACDYLLKPYDQRRLNDVLAHARTRLPMPPQKIQVDLGDRTVFLDPLTLDWASAAGNYVELHLEDGRVLLARATLEGVAARLDASAFVRLSRSAIVRVGAIAEMHKLPHGELRVCLRGGAALTWTRRYRTVGPFVPPLGQLVPKL